MENRKTYKFLAREHLLGLIRNGQLRPGDRLPPQRKLAEDLKISQKVAMVALNELAEEGIIVRHRGSGSFVADPAPRSWSAPPEGSVFLALVGNLRNPQCIEFVTELENRLAERRYCLRVLTAHAFPDTRGMMEYIANTGAAGFVTMIGPDPVRQYAARYHLPCVELLINPPAAGKRDSRTLVLDVGRQSELLAQHLLSQGYRRFALAGGWQEENGEPSYRFRVLARLLKKAGASCFHVPEEAVSMQNMDYERLGSQLASEILKRGISPETAAVFFNSARALGAMKYFSSRNVPVPEQLGVAAFDNIHLAHLMEPQLTMTDAGYGEAARLAAEELTGPGSGAVQYVEPKLCPGRSTRSVARQEEIA